MSEKHVIVCDGCGKEEPHPGRLYIMPPGWYGVSGPYPDAESQESAANLVFNPHHLCSLACVGTLAEKLLAAGT